MRLRKINQFGKRVDGSRGGGKICFCYLPRFPAEGLLLWRMPGRIGSGRRTLRPAENRRQQNSGGRKKTVALPHGAGKVGRPPMARSLLHISSIRPHTVKAAYRFIVQCGSVLEWIQSSKQKPEMLLLQGPGEWESRLSTAIIPGSFPCISGSPGQAMRLHATCPAQFKSHRTRGQLSLDISSCRRFTDWIRGVFAIRDKVSPSGARASQRNTLNGCARLRLRSRLARKICPVFRPRVLNDWIGAGDRDRTGDIQLGKSVLD
jgi:hypothetical protein